jgi:hypothetical protein
MERKLLMRYLIVMIFFCLILPSFAIAETIIGRLFFTPEQRQHLERLRVDHQQQSESTVSEAEDVGPLLSTLPHQKIQGYVKRNDAQKITIWLNGKASQIDSNHALE